jgi:hypothetical protein
MFFRCVNIVVFLSLFYFEGRFFLKFDTILANNGLSRLRIGMVTVLKKAALCVAVVIAGSALAHAETQSVKDKVSLSPFAALDNVIEDLMAPSKVIKLPPSVMITETEALVGKAPTIGQIVRATPPVENDILKNNGIVNEPAKKIEAEEKTSQDESVLKTRITDIPKGTLFEFTTDLFIPANKGGYLFLHGEPKFTFETGLNSGQEALFSSGKNAAACILESNKSYVMMKGANGAGTSPTSLYIRDVTFYSGTSDYAGFVVFDFEPKTPKGLSAAEAAKNTVNISVSCMLDAENAISGGFKTTTLGFLDKSLNGLFKFSLPQYIEI